METGVVIEYRAKCSDCKWHGRRFGNKANAIDEANHHMANLKHEDVEVEETTVNNNHPEMSEEEAKLLFIRKSAQEAYEKNEVLEKTKGILKTIVEEVIVPTMSKDEIGLHIARLEKARSFLAAFTQGIQIGYAKEQEPLFKAKHEKERQEKLAKKLSEGSKDKKVNDLIELARKLASGDTIPEKPKVVVNKVKCDKCNKEVFSLKFHTC